MVIFFYTILVKVLKIYRKRLSPRFIYKAPTTHYSHHHNKERKEEKTKSTRIQTLRNNKRRLPIMPSTQLRQGSNSPPEGGHAPSTPKGQPCCPTFRRCLRRGHPCPLVLDRRTPSRQEAEQLTPEHGWTGQHVAGERTSPGHLTSHRNPYITHVTGQDQEAHRHCQAGTRQKQANHHRADPLTILDSQGSVFKKKTTPMRRRRPIKRF